jgi:hypothetical protein
MAVIVDKAFDFQSASLYVKKLKRGSPTAAAIDNEINGHLAGF